MFTMSSSSPTSNMQSTMGNAPTKDPSLYRRADYCDGKSVRIVESRRRPKVDERTTPRSSFRTPSTSLLSAPSLSERTNTSRKVSSSLSSSGRKSKGGPSHDGHVIPYSPKSHARAVVIQAPRPEKLPKSSSITQTHNGFMTPPPTPRMERLSTPDLEDLDLRPFCDCCTGMNHVKYCASCGQSLEPCT
ncbi:hypothetical protein DM02DRAFT_265998 [Periconia macrospinosa]|uniref:Uncharacterized protein n=1 Tax=Periconia macrospinosa TaxID=97972 RepID=A0A2V1E246_9PLEO|nr:hypothetical protein DM02DRAFT_265998 [Periconia macrospinosa]